MAFSGIEKCYLETRFGNSTRSITILSIGLWLSFFKSIISALLLLWKVRDAILQTNKSLFFFLVLLEVSAFYDYF